MVMRDIRASVEVRALIGASRLRELQGKASTRYECWQCGSQGRTTDATSVIVVGPRVFRVVMPAHADGAEPHTSGVGPDMRRAVTGATAAPPHPRHQGGGAAGGLRRSETPPEKGCPP